MANPTYRTASGTGRQAAEGHGGAAWPPDSARGNGPGCFGPVDLAPIRAARRLRRVQSRPRRGAIPHGPWGARRLTLRWMGLIMAPPHYLHRPAGTSSASQPQSISMPGSRWTLMLVPHDNERVRSFQVKWQHVRNVVSTAVLVVFLLGTFTVAFFIKQGQHVQSATLRRENELLASEVDEMRQEMEQLNRSIETLSKRDEQYREMSGLAAVSGDVRRAGIGGPDVRSVSEQALMRLNPEVGG